MEGDYIFHSYMLYKHPCKDSKGWYHNIFLKICGNEKTHSVHCSPYSEHQSFFPFWTIKIVSNMMSKHFLNTTIYILQTQDILLYNHSTIMQIWKLMQYYNAIHRFHSNFANSSTIYLFPPFLSKVLSRVMIWIFILLQFVMFFQAYTVSDDLETLLGTVRFTIWRISLNLVSLNVSSIIESVHDLWGELMQCSSV